jgi:hypothetical protein
MASIQLNIPDAQAQRVLDAVADRFGWTPELGVTKAAFAKQQVAEWLKRLVVEYERRVAIDAAIASVQPPAPPDVS